MKRSIDWSRNALDDLREQVLYIAQENPAASRRIAARLRKAAGDLATLKTGRIGSIAGTYEKVLTDLPYIIVYAPTRGQHGEIITILRVIHTARRWPPSTEADNLEN